MRRDTRAGSRLPLRRHMSPAPLYARIWGAYRDRLVGSGGEDLDPVPPLCAPRRL
jgi:hypothetical protein